MSYINLEKKVCFDLGNVLCRVNFTEFLNFVVEQDIVKDQETAYEFLSGIQHPQDLGLYNIRQGFYRFYPHISKQILHELHDIWDRVVEPSDTMIGLLDDLLSNNFEIALLSNIGFDHSSVLRNKCDIFKKCHQHFSCEVGARKPSKLFYQSFYLQYGWDKSVFFFDDLQENLAGANGYLTGVLFDLKNFKNDEDAASFIKTKLDLK